MCRTWGACTILCSLTKGSSLTLLWAIYAASAGTARWQLSSRLYHTWFQRVPHIFSKWVGNWYMGTHIVLGHIMYKYILKYCYISLYTTIQSSTQLHRGIHSYTGYNTAIQLNTQLYRGTQKSQVFTKWWPKIKLEQVCKLFIHCKVW